MKRKKQLFSLLLAVSVFFASLQMGTKKVNAAMSSEIILNATVTSAVRDGNTIWGIYDYNSYEDKNIFNTEDEIWVTGEGKSLTLMYKGEAIVSVGDGEKIHFPEYNGITNWIIQSVGIYNEDKQVVFSLLPYDAIVPNVYFLEKDGTPIKLKLSGTPDQYGMVKCVTEDGELYKDLDISVSQYVYPIQSNQLKITVSSPNSVDTVGSWNFIYYKDADKSTQYDIDNTNILYRNEGYCVGSTDEVNIYIEPNGSLIEVNASVEGGNGSIAPEGLIYLRKNGSGNIGKQAYIITPDTGYILDKFMVNNTEETPTEEENVYKYTAGPAEENITLVASFKKKTYDINTEILGDWGQFYTYNAENGEYVGISNQGYICEYDSDITVYIKPEEGYEIKNFSDSKDMGVDVSSLVKNSDGYFEYTISNVSQVHNLKVEFGKIIFIVKSSMNNELAGGEIFYIDNDGNECTFMNSAYAEYEYGSNSEIYYLKAYDGYKLVEFKDKLSGSSSSENLLETLDELEIDGKMYKTYRVKDIKGNHDLYIKCLKEMFVAASVKDNIGGSITGASETLMYQDETYTITADTGYVIKKVTDNGEDVTSKVIDGKYEIQSIQENHTIEVEFAKQVYNINASVKDQVGGSITGDAQAGHGDEKVYTITPDTGYEIKKVTDNGEDVTSKVTDGKYTITAIENHTIEVEFAKLVYNINVSVKDQVGGSITGDSIAEYGNEKVYTITPDTGYEIKKVTDNEQDVTLQLDGSNYKVTVTEPHTIEVEFTKIVFNVSLIVKGQVGGTITGAEKVGQGAVRTYTITPDTGYEIKKVTDNGEDVTLQVTDGKYTITAMENHTIEVEFAKLVYSINASVKDQVGGSIAGDSIAEYGNEKVYTITPDAGYEIKKVTDNGEDVTSKVTDGKYTITAIENHTIEVEFAKLVYNINVSVKDGVGGSITGDSQAEYGAEKTYTIITESDYAIFKVTDNGKDVTSQADNGKYTITVTENHLIEVEFVKNAYTVNLAVKGQVGGTITGAEKVGQGAVKTYTITPDIGYEIKKVTDNEEDVTSKVIDGKYTITVMENHTITVEFIEIEEDDSDDNSDDVSGETNTDKDVKSTIKVGINGNVGEIPYEKTKDGTVKVDLTDDKIIEKLIENSQSKVLSLDFSSALSSEQPLEIKMSGKWFDKDGTIKGISVKSFAEIYINDLMLSNYKINPEDIVILEVRKGSIIVNMKINGVPVSEVDRKNQIKLDYEHGLGKNTDKNNTVAVEILDNGAEKVLPFAMLKDNDTDKITILTPKFGEFEAVLKQSKGFADIDKNWSWAKNNIEFVTAREIFAGTSENTFSPEMTVTRGMFVTIIGRLYGVDKEYKLTFTDVDKNAYYANYVAWANVNGIVSGIGNGQFAPDKAITRQEMAVIFANYINFIGYDMKEAEEKILFSDNSDIAAWAAQAVELMQRADILNGVGDNSFAPNNTTTRAEVATAVTNFIKTIVNTYSLEADEREVL